MTFAAFGQAQFADQQGTRLEMVHRQTRRTANIQVMDANTGTPKKWAEYVLAKVPAKRVSCGGRAQTTAYPCTFRDARRHTPGQGCLVRLALGPCVYSIFGTRTCATARYDLQSRHQCDRAGSLRIKLIEIPRL